MNPIVPSLSKSGRATDTKSMDALAEIDAVAPPSDLPNPTLTENAVKVLEMAFEKEPDYTRAGVLSAVTRAARCNLTLPNKPPRRSTGLWTCPHSKACWPRPLVSRA